MGEALLMGDNIEEATRLIGAADRLFGDMGLTHGMAASERPPIDAVRDRLRALLGEERFTAGWDAGRAMERDAAVAEALALANPARGGDAAEEG
jgi:hypothetical protein